jgi:hypothetical protein
MTDDTFGLMAYGLGPRKQIRDRLLDSAIMGDPVGEAEQSVLWIIRRGTTKAEAAWLRKYDAARAQGTMAEMKGGGA